jgi:hypothetical protein
MGNVALTKLWNQYPDNMEACSAPERDFLPQMDDYFAEAIAQLDPANQIEQEYKYYFQSFLDVRVRGLLCSPRTRTLKTFRTRT